MQAVRWLQCVVIALQSVRLHAYKLLMASARQNFFAALHIGCTQVAVRSSNMCVQAYTCSDVLIRKSCLPMFAGCCAIGVASAKHHARLKDLCASSMYGYKDASFMDAVGTGAADAGFMLACHGVRTDSAALRSCAWAARQTAQDVRQLLLHLRSS